MAQKYITRKGYEKLVKELEMLRERKARLAKEIGEAREQGDLRENAGYQYAREKQTETLRRIAELEERLNSSVIIDDLNLPKDKVIIGVTVTIQDEETQDVYVYTLVGAEEADPGAGKISVHAPLAEGLLGHGVGESVVVNLPGGSSKFKILKIQPGV